MLAGSPQVCVYMCATSLKITYVNDCTTKPGEKPRNCSVSECQVIYNQFPCDLEANKNESPGIRPWGLYVDTPPHPTKHTSPWIHSLRVTGVAFGMMALLELKSSTLHLVLEPGRSQLWWNILVCSSRPTGKNHHLPHSVTHLSSSDQKKVCLNV